MADDILESAFTLGPGSAAGMAPSFAPEPPAPPPQQTDPLQQRLTDLRGREMSTIDRYERLSQERSDIAEEKTKALAPLRQRMMDYNERPLPEPPKQQAPPPAPKRNNPQDDENWLQAAMILGGLVGGLTRRHMTNALAAFTGAIEGYNEGSRQKFDQNMRIWEAENKRTLETNNQAIKNYQEILQNHKLNAEQMSVELQLAAAQYDDKAMEIAAKSKNTLDIAKLLDTSIRYTQQMAKSGSKLAENHEEAKIRQLDEAAEKYVNSPAGLSRAREIAMGLIPPPPTTQRTGYEGAVQRHLLDKVIQISREEFGKEFDATQWGANQVRAKTAPMVERQRELIDPRKEAATVMEFTRGVSGRSVQSLNVAIDHLDVLKSLSDALKNNDVKMANRLQQFFAEQLGVAAPVDFDNAKQIVAQEVVKAVVPGGGSMQERREAAEGLVRSLSPEQFDGVVSTLQRLMSGQLLGLQKRYEFGSKRKDFDEMLEDATKNTLRSVRERGIPDPESEMRELINQMGKNASGAWSDAAKGMIGTTNRGDRTEPAGQHFGAPPGPRPLRSTGQPATPNMPIPLSGMPGWTVQTDGAP